MRPLRLGFPVKVMGRPDLKSNDTRGWRQNPHLKVSIEVDCLYKVGRVCVEVVEVWAECPLPWIDLPHQHVRLSNNVYKKDFSYQRSASRVLDLMKRLLDPWWVVWVDSSKTLGSLSGGQKEDPL